MNIWYQAGQRLQSPARCLEIRRYYAKTKATNRHIPHPPFDLSLFTPQSNRTDLDTLNSLITSHSQLNGGINSQPLKNSRGAKSESTVKHQAKRFGPRKQYTLAERKAYQKELLRAKESKKSKGPISPPKSLLNPSTLDLYRVLPPKGPPVGSEWTSSWGEDSECPLPR